MPEASVPYFCHETPTKPGSAPVDGCGGYERGEGAGRFPTLPRRQRLDLPLLMAAEAMREERGAGSPTLPRRQCLDLPLLTTAEAMREERGQADF